jgi:integrase
MALPQGELAEIAKARASLAEYGKTITEAARFYLDHVVRVLRCKTTVSELTKEVLKAKQKDDRSRAYLDDLRKRLTRFCKDFGDRSVAAITVQELDSWLRNLELSPKSRANYRANVGVLFSYAERLGMIDRNPILRTGKPKLIDKAPEIFTVDELRSLLAAATQTAPDVVPMLAIGAFAGLREAEIKRLDWAEVNLARGHVEVKASKAKSARRRIVPILPSLAAWLRPYSQKGGHVVPANARKKLAKIRKAAALLKWPNNGLRHSFASYRLAAIHDAPRVSAELGHTSPQMLYGTYRELVHPEEADRYWQVMPAAEADKVVEFTGT